MITVYITVFSRVCIIHAPKPFYAETPDLDPQDIDRILDRFPDYEFSGGTEEDPDWKKYLTNLYPNWMGYQFILVRRTLASASGEIPGPVAITHYLYFDSGEERKRFCSGLDCEGLEVTSDDYLEPCFVNSGYRLRVTHRPAPNLESINAMCETLIAASQNEGSEYCHFEIDSPAIGRHDASREALIRIASEVEAGVRDSRDLERFGVSVGDWNQISTEEFMRDTGLDS